MAGWTDEFVDTVFAAEYKTVMARRREVAKRAAAREGRDIEDPPDRAIGGPLVPSTKLRLFGLAFSGGGIRSATFNLGLLQALAKRGLLSRFDYLSTVSGGGYIGSCLSSLLNRPQADSTWTHDFPFHLESGRQEPVALRHLRNHSNYLLAAGTQGYLGGGALILRGMLVNTVAMLPFVVALVALTRWLYGPRLAGGLRAELPFYSLTLLALAVFGLAVALFPLTTWATYQRKHPYGMDTRRRAGASYALLLKVGLSLALFESLPLVLGWYNEHRTNGTMLEGLTWLSVVGTMAPGVNSQNNTKPGILHKIAGALKLLAVSAVGPLLLLLAYLVLARWVVFPGTAPFDDALVPWVVYGSAGALLVYALLFLNANATSIHQYYRDRLSLAYLFQVVPREPESGSGSGSGSVRSTDALRMTELNAAGTIAPYHLINTTLNLAGSKDINLRGRQGDFFVFSKHYVGSERTGYCATSDMEAADRRLTLGTAMAISAAAASPNMGTLTVRSLAFVMTLLNIRLGYWLVHPRRVAAHRRGLSSNTGVGLGQLLTEALSRTVADGRHVNVSDGAHIENLGVYELLRRRCRVIVCGDGEGDPDMTFSGLATVIRYALTDMGIHIDINLEDFNKDAQGRSKHHHAIGRIDYGDGEIGWLLYIKSSIGRRELPYIEHYRHANPEFPHQSTADQFFDEAQFEAYRALGFKVGMRTMQALHTLQEAADDDELFEFGAPGAARSVGEDEGTGPDAVEGGLSRNHRSAPDPEPPW
ncbi:MAG: patatin-like phospholipase family protein [Myxococcota bacterium]